MFPVAVDYGRFSATIQELGTSKDRQKSLSDAWTERTGVPIDKRLFDEGVSGYKNQRRRLEKDDLFDLARFLKMVESGEVQPGDYLLLENFDRLSRDKEVKATHLLTRILVKGVKVVQLAPYELELSENSDMFAVFRAVLELSRGHGESERKHQTVSASFANNRLAAARKAETYQGALPKWLRREGRGKGAKYRRVALVEDRAAVVRQIYRWAIDGWGFTRIARRLNAEGVQPFGARKPRIDPETGQQARTRRGRLRWEKDGEQIGAGEWTRPYVVKIIRDRAAMGELKTRTGDLLPIPAAVTEEDWLAAQAGRRDRNNHRGRNRTAGPENLWQGMLTDAISSDGIYEISRQKAGYGTWRVLINARGNTGEAEARSFPAAAFEAAVLACLKEIRPEEITKHGEPDQVSVLAERVETLRNKIARQAAEIDASDEPAPRSILQMLSRWEAEAGRLEEERRQAEQEAAHPLSEAWGQAKSLLDLVKTAEQRLRLRSLLRRVVEEIRVLIVPRGWDRVAAVQMRFKGSDQVRSYIVAFRKDVMPDGRKASRVKRERGEDIVCYRSVRKGAALDLRGPAHVRAAQKKLLDLDLARFQEESKALRV
jgi:hypothetical protein